MLAFEVEYLLGRVYAGDFRDRAEPEWPPHPARLFSALAAAYFEGGKNDRERVALEWLERQGPPAIRAGSAGNPARVTAFVPTNYPGDGPPILRGKQPRVFAAQSPSDATVHFLWLQANPEREIRKALDDLASRTGYLGKACSLVRMCVVDSAPEPSLLPDANGKQVLRTVAPGRLDELAWLFEADQRPTPGLQQPYCWAADAVVPIASGYFGEMLGFERKAGVGLPIEAALTLTDAVRKALMSVAGNGGPVAGPISGHGEGPHCAVVALPFIGERHADGRIMGVAIVLPRTITPSDRLAVHEAWTALKQVNLGSPLGNWQVERDESPTVKTRQSSTWTRPSRWWASATPIVLDRFPKKKGPTIEELICTACERTGLPRPVRITHGRFSKEAGVPPVVQFRLQRKKDESARWAVHARLEFEVPVQGPVILGAGRFFGLGLMKPVPEWRDDD